MEKPTDDEAGGEKSPPEEVQEETLPPRTAEQDAASVKHFKEQGKWYNR